MEFQQANIFQQMVMAAVEELAGEQPPPTESTLEPVLQQEVTHTANATVMETNQQLMQQMTEMMQLMQQMQAGQCIPTTLSSNNSNSRTGR